jgi:hypothetical protein
MAKELDKVFKGFNEFTTPLYSVCLDKYLKQYKPEIVTEIYDRLDKADKITEDKDVEQFQSHLRVVARIIKQSANLYRRPLTNNEKATIHIEWKNKGNGSYTEKLKEIIGKESSTDMEYCEYVLFLDEMKKITEGNTANGRVECKR